MKLSDWARKQGIAYQTAYKWWRSGILPVQAHQLPTGTILVDEPESHGGSVAVYAHVSSNDQKDGLDGQIARTVAWATAQGLSVDRVVSETGSALNGARPRFMKLLSDPEVGTIVCEHRDRACRFGFDYLAAALRAQGRRILLVDDSEIADDLVRDMTEVLTSLCARIYGKRGAVKRAAAAADAAREACPVPATGTGS